MSTFWRRARLVVMLLLLGGGCNPLMLPFFLTSEEPKIPAELHRLSDKDKKKDVKVVILTDTGLETRSELLHADKEITRLFAMQLQKLCKENGDKLSVVNPYKVEEFKASNPDWATSHVELETVGKHFEADYVIYLEVSDLSLYQASTANQFFQGRANMRVSLINVRKPDDFTVAPRELNFSYPPENQGGNRLADADTTPQAFRLEFFNALAKRLSWYFTDHPTRDSYLGN